MHVVGHHDPGIEANMGKVARDALPTVDGSASIVAEKHLIPVDFPQETLAATDAGGDKAPAPRSADVGTNDVEARHSP